jgi:hypothetical protein
MRTGPTSTPTKSISTRSRPRTGTLAARMLALTLGGCTLSGCTLEQIQIGQWYTLDTPAAGACPNLQWHFEVNPQRAMGGFVTRGQQRIASFSGVLNADDSFQVTAADAASSRTANVAGQFTSDVSTLSIHGDAIGSACDGQSFELRLRSYFSRQGGGGGGGG